MKEKLKLALWSSVALVLFWFAFVLTLPAYYMDNQQPVFQKVRNK